VEDELDRVGAAVPAQQHRRLVGVEDEGRAAALVLHPAAVEALDRGAVVAAVDPAVARPELELGEPGIRLDRLNGGEHAGHVDAVHVSGLALDGLRAGHRWSPVDPSRCGIAAATDAG
jgi:hypothetical protein